MSSEKTVFLVDDHRMFRDGLRSRLEREPDIRVVGEASTGSEGVCLVKQTNPSIVILDIRLPDMSGIEVAQRIKEHSRDIKIIVLSGYDFDQYVRAMARIGVNGYLLKDQAQDHLIEAIKEVSEGGTVLPPKIASKVIRSYSAEGDSKSQASYEDLTLREIEVLELLHQGFRNIEIAEMLSLSIRTVENHVSSLIGKLGAQTRFEAVRIAQDKGLLK